jgi:hypothetical protein
MLYGRFRCFDYAHGDAIFLEGRLFAQSNTLISEYLIFMFQFNVSFISRAGHVTGMGEKRNAYRDLMGKPEGKSPLARSAVHLHTSRY